MRIWSLLFCLLFMAPPQASAASGQCTVLLQAFPQAGGTDKAPPTQILGQFEAELREDSMTTRHYQLPGTTQMLTASVLYVDDIQLFKPGKDMVYDVEVIIGIAIAEGKLESAFDVTEASQNDHATASANYSGELLLVKAMKATRLQGGQRYMVALYCLHNGATETK